jgi:DNA-binding NtrC family response regulator
MVLAKQFRKDLYYRLNEFSMVIPPLRERPDDIMFLANRFLEYAKADLGKDIRGFSDEAAALLLSFDWPGNVRELRNIIRRAALRADDKGLQPLVITQENLAVGAGAFSRLQRDRPIPETGKALSAQERFFEAAPEQGEPARGPDGSMHCPSLRQTVQRTVSHVEKQVITEALIQTKGNKAEAARMLGVDYKTMHTKMKKYEICQREDKRLQPLVQPAKGESYVQT